MRGSTDWWPMFPVEAFRATLEKFHGIVEACGLRYHLTGGVVGNALDEPRMTQDIDIVIDPNGLASRVDELLTLLSDFDFEFHAASIRAAIDRGSMFQLLDRNEVLKLDIYPRELIPGELSRSEVFELFEGWSVPIVSIVDAAASKLIWIGEGSHKSRRELRAIVRKLSDGQHREFGVSADAPQLRQTYPRPAASCRQKNRGALRLPGCSLLRR